MKNKSYIGETIRNAIKASTLTDKEISELKSESVITQSN